MRPHVPLVLEALSQFAQECRRDLHVLGRDMVCIVDFSVTVTLAENYRIVQMPLHLNNYWLVLVYPVTLNLDWNVACHALLIRWTIPMRLVLGLGMYLALRVLEVLYHHHITSKVALYYWRNYELKMAGIQQLVVLIGVIQELVSGVLGWLHPSFDKADKFLFLRIQQITTTFY